MKNQIVSKLSPIPLPLQLRDFIRGEIKSGRVQDSSKLPKENELGEVFGLSEAVVNEAYELLAQGGLARKTSKGYFVSIRPTIYFNIDEFLDTDIVKPQCTRTLMLVELLNNGDGINVFAPKHFDLTYHAKYTIRYMGYPAIYQNAYFPEEYYGNIAGELQDGIIPSSIIRKALQGGAAEFCTQLSTAVADEQTALLLAIHVGDPVHHVKTFVYNNRKEVVSCLESYLPGDYAELEVSYE